MKYTCTKEIPICEFYERGECHNMEDCALANPKPEHLKMAYVAHPFLGKTENVADVEIVILKLLKLYPDMTFYSPLNATGFFYFELSYEDGMEHCFEALRRCDELWLCEGWEKSTGCNLEVDFAKEHNIPIYVIKADYSLEVLNG